MSVRPALLVIVSFALAFAVPPALDSNPALTPSPTIPHLVPPKGNDPSQEPQFYVFSWQEFFALNWPAKMTSSGQPERGVPDPDGVFGEVKPGIPRVWETWKADYELFPVHQSGTLTPTPWSSWEVEGGDPCATGTGLRTLPFIAKGESVVLGGVNQAMGGPLVDQKRYYVRYEIRVNQSEYEKIVKNNWFLRKNVNNYPNPPNLLDASTQDTYGAIELKAAWRRVDDSEKSRYYTTQAVLVDPKTGKCGTKPVTMGLVGLHIAHKTGGFKAWVWSTFEQVDNVSKGVGLKCPHSCSFYDGKYNDKSLYTWGFSPSTAYKPKNPDELEEDGHATPVQVIRLNPIKEMIKTLNDQVHHLQGVKGTVWENYELVAGQWQDIENQPDPIPISNDTTAQDLYPTLVGFPTTDAIANTSMETFYQGRKGELTPEPARNPMGIPAFGTSCLHCHYAAAQYDFSWMLADQAWPSSPGSQGTTKSDLKAKKGKH